MPSAFIFCTQTALCVCAGVCVGACMCANVCVGACMCVHVCACVCVCVHVILVAGFSADSGLPIYDEIGNEPAWQERELTYSDLCRPSMLETDPEIAYGFWGSCFNLYRDTTPHHGYSVVRKWCESKESWYVYTSNVDGHFKASGFDERRVLEMHGTLGLWIPRGRRVEAAAVKLDEAARFPVESGSRLLRGAQGVPRDANGDLMRPAVLMFDDEHPPLLALLKVGQDRYQEWEAEVEEELSKNSGTRLVIIELGCGTRVPVVRQVRHTAARKRAARARVCVRCVLLRRTRFERGGEGRANLSLCRQGLPMTAR